MIMILSAALLASFDCELQAPRALTFDGPNARASEMGLASEARRFTIAIDKGTSLTANVVWPNDPIQVAGTFPAIETAPGAFAFSASSTGPCMFTEQACLSQVSLVGQADGTARVIVAPVALSKDEAAGTRSLFAVIAVGQCRRTDLKQ